MRIVWCLVLVAGGIMPGVSYGADPLVENVVLGIHGGTGIEKKDMTPEHAEKLKSALAEALKAGYAKLNSGGAALDAVEAATRSLEDCPLFNAGKGAVFTHEGRNELDASIMDGKTRKAGAVAGVTVVKNPISAARAVMEKSPHVMMIGRGAEVFATQQDLEIVDPSYFWTEERWKAIQKIWAAEKKAHTGMIFPPEEVSQYGTVGAVALDAGGNLAAATSTGGMSNKMFGRVGDSPIIGAGTYAANDAAAVSCTGHGEYFIRWSVAHEIASQVRYRKVSIKEAADDVIQKQLKEVDGEGASIVLDPQGRFTTSYNSEGLYRGWITKDGKITVRLYED